MSNARTVAIALLLYTAGQPVGYAQGRQACDLVTKADVEAIMGGPLEPPQPGTPYRSLFDAERRDPATGRILGGGGAGSSCSYTNLPQGASARSMTNVLSAYIELRDAAAPDAAIIDAVLQNIDEQTYDDPQLLRESTTLRFGSARRQRH